MNRQTKELKDYTDNELIREITQRIDNYSLDPSFLAILMIHIGLKYLEYYQEKQRAKKEKQYE